MSKRAREAESNGSSASHKKRRQREEESTTASQATDSLQSHEIKNEKVAEKKSKKRKKAKDHEVNEEQLKKSHQDDELNEKKVEESSKKGNVDAKKERKRLKKEAKAAHKAAAAQQTSASAVVSPGLPVSSTCSSKAPASNHTSITPRQGGYRQDPKLSAVPQKDIDAYLESSQIKVVDNTPGGGILRPMTEFCFMPNSSTYAKIFQQFSAPTPIQAATWPHLFSGRDVIGVAETGSGKTLGFGLPCIQKILGLSKKSQGQGIKAVIVSPTRELACQIHEQMQQLAEPAGLHVVCVYGGVAKDEQRCQLSKAQIVVATPGRLNDLMNEGAADLSGAELTVLDEADRMLDRGFEQDIRTILSACAPTDKRQTVMFTATWPESVRDLANTFMTKPVQIYIGDRNCEGELHANTRIEQVVQVMEPRGKDFRLLQLLREFQRKNSKQDRVLIFCLYKKEATRVENLIRANGFNVAGIHGDLSQQKRTASLQSFKTGQVPLLVATDVAARGLDIPAVKLVLNVTFPLTAEDYVHRIGRTGRAGQVGKAITFFTEHEKHLSGALISVLKSAGQPVPEDLLKFGTTVKKKEHAAYGAFFKQVDSDKKPTKITFE